MVKKHIDDKIVKVIDNVTDIQKSIVENKRIADYEKEKEQRRSNIIMFNAKEKTNAAGRSSTRRISSL